MGVLKRAAPGALLLLCGACDWRAAEPAGFANDPLNVHAVLMADSPAARVLLSRVADRERVSGAAGALTRGAEVFAFRESPAGESDCERGRLGEPREMLPGCYLATVADGIRPGERFVLRLETPASDALIEGSAMIPERPRILAPRERVVFTVGPDPSPRQVRVQWQGPAAGSVAVGVLPRATFRGGARQEATCTLDVRLFANGSPFSAPTGLIPGHSATLSIFEASCRRGAGAAAWDSVQASIEVVAFDSAYARYAREVLARTTVRPGATSAGVRGAWGVFAGAAAASIPILILPASTASSANPSSRHNHE